VNRAGPGPTSLITRRARALFDTGMHPDCQDDPEKRARARAIAQLFRFDYRKGEEVSARLEAIGRDPRKINLIVNSHLHFDHVGRQTSAFPMRPWSSRSANWDAGQNPEMAAARGFQPAATYDLGHKIKIVDGEHDLFGDGQRHAACRPMATRPGHQSLKVRLATGDVVPRRRCLLFSAGRCASGDCR